MPASEKLYSRTLGGVSRKGSGVKGFRERKGKRRRDRDDYCALTETGGCSVNENHDCTGGSHVPVTFSPAQNDLFTFSDITLS